MKVIPHETTCPVVSAVTGLNIRCSAPHCPAWDEGRGLCDVGERPAAAPVKKPVPLEGTMKFESLRIEVNGLRNTRIFVNDVELEVWSEVEFKEKAGEFPEFTVMTPVWGDYLEK